MNDNKDFKPYIPAEKITPEFTATSIIMGLILAVVFGAANAYLGLRVGMTISASIPSAVISMGVIRVIMKKNSILESNMVQTIGSAGESLAAGAIFTMPALFLWAEEGLCDKPGLVEITLIALCGGILGVLFMVPLRNALIVKEHATLSYPEGTACADVLLAGEEGGSNAATVFSGMGIAAIFKFVVDGLKVVPADVAAAFKSFKGEIGMEVYPALLGVGYIVGPKIASFMFVGSLIGWMVIVPLICLFGPDTWLYPADQGVTIAQLYADGGASAIWTKYVKYIGAGAIATGGIISLIKSLPLIVKTFRDSMRDMKGGTTKGTLRTEQDISMATILIGIVAMVFIIWIVPAIPVNLLGAALIVVFGFFFATVSARMVGMIGSSNNPVSGMAIATLLIATMAIKASGQTGIDGMKGAIAICCCGDRRRYFTGPENRLSLRRDAEETADRRDAGCCYRSSCHRRSSLSSGRCMGLRHSRRTGAAGSSDEDDRRGNHGRKSSLEPGIHRRVPGTGPGDSKNPGNAFCDRSLPSDLSERYHYDRRRCTSVHGRQKER